MNNWLHGEGVYPERFADISVHEWVLEFYRRTYRIEEPQARLLRRSQWLDNRTAAVPLLL